MRFRLLVLLVSLSAGLSAMAAPPLVRNPRTLPKYGNEYPLEIYVGNFGGDAANDVLSVVAGHSIQVIINAADGGITGESVISPITETGIESAATGDLDADGDLDVAVSVAGAQQLVTYLNAGNGTFTRGTIISGQHGSEIGIADFTRDGHADLSLAREAANGYGVIEIFAGNGAGAFAAPSQTALAARPHIARVVDANGDGKPDLLAATSSSIFVALSRGDGTFAVSSVDDLITPSYDLATGDFNADGAIDFVVIGGAAGNKGFLRVFRGTGTGTFTAAGDHYGMEYFAVTVADVDADGRLDLVGGSYAGNFAVLRGNGDATFDAPELWHTGHVWDLVAGDFSRDGIADVVMFGSGDGSNRMQFVAGTGGGAFDTYRAFLPGGLRPYSSWYYDHVWQAEAADVNHDGAPDVIAMVASERYGDSDIAVMLNAKDSMATMLPPIVIHTTVGEDHRPTVNSGDVNGDGKLDLVLTQLYGYDITQGWTYLGRGDGTFEAPLAFPVAGGGQPGLADVTGDGVLDLVSGGRLYRGLNNGSFGSPLTLTFPAQLTGDVNGDGRIDFVGHDFRDTVVAINNGDGTSFTRTVLPDGDYAAVAALADIDGDGPLDILFLSWSEGVFTRFGNGDGTFGEPQYFPVAPAIFNSGSSLTATGDFDGDGELDLTSSLRFYLGRGDGTFDGYGRVDAHSIGSFDVADFDGNGTDDLASVTGNTALSIIRTNLGPDAALTATIGLTSTPNPSQYATLAKFVATVSGGIVPPTGAVVFASNGKAFAMRDVTVLAAGAFGVLPAGTNAVTATYVGDERYASVTATLEQVVNRAPTSVEGSVGTPLPAPCGTEIRVYAVVQALRPFRAPGPGPLLFREGNTLLGARPAPGFGPGWFLVSGLGAGTHTVVAEFPGDANYTASSKTFSVQVSPSDATITAGSTVYANGTGFATARVYEGATYTWSITNGTIDSGQGSANLRYTAGASGEVALGLTITQPWCNASAARTVAVIPQPPGATMFHLLPACRVVDTRGGAPLADGATRELVLAGLCGIPSDAKSLALNVTVVAPAGTGWLSFYAADSLWPGTSTVSYRPGRTRTNGAIVPVSPNARLKVLHNGPAVHFVIDLFGFFR